MSAGGGEGVAGGNGDGVVGTTGDVVGGGVGDGVGAIVGAGVGAGVSMVHAHTLRSIGLERSHVGGKLSKLCASSSSRLFPTN